MAIQGDGFLLVREKAGAVVYSRGGNLQVDKLGSLMTSTGQRVQGWTAQNGVLSTNAPPGDIVIPVGSLKEPVATTEIAFDINLNASAAAGPPPDTFVSSIEVFDSLGQSHVATVTFTKAATPNSWGYSLSFPDADVTAPVAPVTGTITFDSSGRMVDPAAAGPFPSMAIAGLANGAADMNLTWNLYNGQAPRLTQYSQASAVSANQQNGSATAQLIRVGIGTGGLVLAQFSNGIQEVVGRLAMASIRNPESLLAVGNNSYALSARSALAAIGTAGSGGRGEILGGAIESSTVDIAREFTNLIVLQRGYQANAKVITTVDELSQETINLKR